MPPSQKNKRDPGEAQKNKRDPGEVPTRRDQSTSFGGHRRHRLRAGHRRKRYFDSSDLAASSDSDESNGGLGDGGRLRSRRLGLLGLFPEHWALSYKVRWLPDEVGANKPKTGTEEIRFAIDLLVAVGFAGLLVLSDPLANPAGQNLFRFLAVLVAIDCLSLLSDVLANHR